MFQCFENHNFLSPLFPFPSTQTVHPTVQERRDARERRQQQHTERLEAKRVELVTKERQKWQRGVSVALGCESWAMKKGPWLFRVYRGSKTTQLCGDYNKDPIGSLSNSQYFMESKAVFFSWLKWFGLFLNFPQCRSCWTWFFPWLSWCLTTIGLTKKKLDVFS